jgi:hypothetical protein
MTLWGVLTLWHAFMFLGLSFSLFSAFSCTIFLNTDDARRELFVCE